MLLFKKMTERSFSNQIEQGLNFLKKEDFYKSLLKENSDNKDFFENKEDYSKFKKNYLKRIELSSKLEEINGNKDLERSLEEILEDPNNKRLILYLPFELIQKNSQFIEKYKKSFLSLLNEIDLREDFNFGDIPEHKDKQTRELPKVSKICHLIPILLEKGIFNIAELQNIIDNQNNKIIINSFCDIFNILLEKKLLTNEELINLSNSKHIEIRNSIKLAKLNLEETELTNLDYNTLIEQYLLELDKNTNKIKDVGNKRLEWVKYQNKEEILNKYIKLLGNKSEKEILDIILYTNNTEEIDLWVRYLENNINKNITIIETLLNTESFKYKDNFTELQNKIINKDFKKENSLEETEKKIKNISIEIEKDLWLKDKIYSAFLLNGSNLKGYADTNSDLDISIFIKPETDFKERKELQNKLQIILDKLNINGSILEFWLEQKDNSLKVKTFESYDEHLGDNAMTHPLISPFYGNQKEIEILQKSLIPYYLQSQDKDILLKNSEHILLQYRLLHKGYYKNHLRENILNSQFNNDVDGDSPFFDSGYRKLATKIYLEKIYLPK